MATSTLHRCLSPPANPGYCCSVSGSSFRPGSSSQACQVRTWCSRCSQPAAGGRSRWQFPIVLVDPFPHPPGLTAGYRRARLCRNGVNSFHVLFFTKEQNFNLYSFPAPPTPDSTPFSKGRDLFYWNGGGRLGRGRTLGGLAVSDVNCGEERSLVPDPSEPFGENIPLFS